MSLGPSWTMCRREDRHGEGDHSETPAPKYVEGWFRMPPGASIGDTAITGDGMGVVLESIHAKSGRGLASFCGGRVARRRETSNHRGRRECETRRESRSEKWRFGPDDFGAIRRCQAAG